MKNRLFSIVLAIILLCGAGLFLSNKSFASNQAEETQSPAFSASKTVDDVVISVNASEGVFPEGSTLSVSKLTEKEQQKVDAVLEELREEDENVAASYSFDITILDKDGKEIQPADEKDVKVTFSLGNVSDSNLETSVYHIDDEKEINADAVEEMQVKIQGNDATVVTDSFSYYTVVFTFSGLHYMLPVGEEVALSEILEAVGLSGTTISVISVSNPDALSATQNGNDWTIKSLQAFTGEESIVVQVNTNHWRIYMEAKNIPVHVVWKDNYGSGWDRKSWSFARPNGMKLSLMNGSEEVAVSEANYSNKWVGSFDSVTSDGEYTLDTSYIYNDKEAFYNRLKEFKRYNKGYTYSYVPTVTGSPAEGFTVTNMLVSDIKGNVIWKGDKSRPDSVTVNLLKNGEVIDSQVVTSADDYAFDFGRYEVYSDDGMITYTTTVDKVTDYYSAPDGYDIVLTPETKVTLTKELLGTSEEKEYLVYLVPIHHQTTLWIQKLARRYPVSLYTVLLRGAQEAIKNAKEYDKTSGRPPVYPLLSKLFDEKWVDEMIQRIDATIESGGRWSDDMYSDEERQKIEEIIPLLLTENRLNDNTQRWNEDNADIEDYEDTDFLEQSRRNSYWWFSIYSEHEEEYAEFLSGGWDSFDQYVDEAIIGNMHFTTTIKAGETKTVNIPAEELISLIVIEADYDDIEEFETIYWNKPRYNQGYISYGDVSALDYIRNGSDQAKSEFEFTLTNKGKPIPAALSLSGKKTLTNGKLTDGQFSFVLKSENKEIDEAACDADGNFSFKEIKYDAEGDHTYTIEEKNTGQDGIIYDTHKETVKVSVTLDEDTNEYVATPIYDSDGVVFINEFVSDTSAGVNSGDNAPTVALIVLLATCSAGVVTMLVKRRKSN